MMAEAGAEQASLELHSLPSKPDSFASIVTFSSEGSTVMDMCVKTEPDEKEISQPAFCTEVLGFSAEEMDSGLHLDTEHIKTETVMVKIMDDDGNLQLCSNTEELFPPPQQLNSSTGLLSTQCKSETGEVKAEQYPQLQELFSTAKKIIGVVFCNRKEEYMDIQVNELNSIPFPSSRQCKSETGEIKVEQHSQVEGPSNKGSAFNEAVGNVLQENSIAPVDSSITVRNDMHTATLPCSVVPLTVGEAHKSTDELCHDADVHKAQEWQCSQCRQVFRSELLMKKHGHSGGKYCFMQHETSVSQTCLLKPYKCTECGRFFSHGGHFKQHKCIHFGEKLYRCCQCGKSFTHRHTLKRHQLVHSGEKPHKCSQCGKTFSLASVLKNHLRVHSGEKPYKCSQCGKCFSQVGNLNIHKRIHSSEKPYQCSECGKSFSLPSVLKNHLHVHSGDKPYMCSQCGKSFVQVGTLNLHKRVHSGEKPYQCNECGKSFSLPSVLKTHLLIHSNEKPYNCRECGKSFSQATSLNVHKFVHSGEKPYKCSQCGKSFSRVATLNLHQRVHTGEKPYKCTDCGKSFSRSGHLKQHLLVHSGEKPYICSECGRGFSQAGPLKRHQRVHSDEKLYMCSQCGKNFAQRSCLENHEKTHGKI